jgi:hypothetical protein
MFWKNVSFKVTPVSVFLLMVFFLAAYSYVYAEPPFAESDDVTVVDPNGLIIELVASDDGLPAPPGELIYIITSLPEHGWLFDPYDGSEIDMIPYTLLNNTSSVTYKPCPYYFEGIDNFSFKANDGGVAPDNGDSNIADVNVVMEQSFDFLYGEGTTSMTTPFFTRYKKVRSQALYLAADLNNSPMTITHVALDIKKLPTIDVQNFKIRMKHTSLTQYEASGNTFDNDGWTEVYNADIPFTDPNAVKGWYDFPLQTSFEYNGVQNLLIDFSFDNTAINQVDPTVNSSTTENFQVISFWSQTVDPLTREIAYNPSDKLLFNIIFTTEPSTDVLLSDFNKNCFVGTDDLITMAEAWLSVDTDGNFNSDCDIIVNNKIDLEDFAVLASEWMDSVEPFAPIVYSIADFNFDRSVNIDDLVIFVNSWPSQSGDIDYNDLCDISTVKDNKIDLADFSVFSSEWMIPEY